MSQVGVHENYLGGDAQVVGGGVEGDLRVLGHLESETLRRPEKQRGSLTCVVMTQTVE